MLPGHKEKQNNLPCKKVFKITIKVLPRSLTRICSQLICVSIIFSVYTQPMVSSFFAQHSRLVGSLCNFPLFWFVEVKQKIIIRNNNLLFKIRWPYYMPAGSKTIKKYALGHYFVASFFALISSKILVSLTILVWYIHQDNHILYLVKI